MFYDERDELMEGDGGHGGDSDEHDEDWGQTIESETSSVGQLIKPQVEHERVIVHIDIDCFYAQVEMIEDPSLRDKPLGIQQKNILVTCNYEARKRGLTKLMFLTDAQKKCSDLVIRNGEDLTKYRDMSAKIFNVLLQYSPLVEKLGMDENFIDVTTMIDVPPWNTMADTRVEGHVYGDNKQGNCLCGCSKRLVIGSHICAEIRRALYTELGITCCGGVSHNKLLAKVVGAQNKPNKQTLLLPGNERQLMASLGRVRNVPGIGHVMAKTLSSMGVLSVADLAEKPLQELTRSMDHHTAQRLQQLAHGIDMTTVTPTGKPQSMGDEDSFKKCATVPDAKSRMSSLAASLLQRVLHDGRHPGTLRLTVRKFDPNRKFFGRECRQRPIPAHIMQLLNKENLKRTTLDLVALCMELFHKMIDVTKPFHLTLINICLTKFSELPAKRGIGAYLKGKEEKNETEGGEKTQGGDAEEEGEDSSWSYDKEDSEEEKNKDKSNDRTDFNHKSISKQNKSKIELLKEPNNQSPRIINTTTQGSKATTTPSKPKSSNSTPKTITSFFSQNRSTCDPKDRNLSNCNKEFNKEGKVDDESEVPEEYKDSVRENIEKPQACLVEPSKDKVTEQSEQSTSLLSLPEDIDVETLKELPQELQREILHATQEQSPTNCDKKTVLDDNNSEVLLGTSIKKPDGEPERCDKKTSEAQTELSGPSHSLRSKQDSVESRKSISSQLPSGVDPTVFAQLPLDVQKSVLADHHAHQIFETPTKLSSSSPSMCSKQDSVESPVSITSHQTKLPSGVDPTVFAQLPPDVQKSVLADHHAHKVQKEFAQMKALKSPPSKRAKTNTSGRVQTNISKFFSKK